MIAMHGHPRDTSACGRPLAFRRPTSREQTLNVCVGGYLFTCPEHGWVLMGIYIT